MPNEKVTRRGYVKYAGAGIVIVAGAAAGAYYATRPGPTPTPTPTTTTKAATTPTTPDKFGGILKYAMEAEPAMLDPHLMQAFVEFMSVDNICQGLYYYDHTLNIQPALAKSYENPDGLSYIFHLRDDVKFHNG